MTDYPLTWLADVLRKGGCRVIEEPGWKTRGRPGSSGRFTPRAILHHWDATSPGSHGAISTVIQGVEGTPGPLCSILTCRGNAAHKPSVHIIAAGRANHGGLGDGWRRIPPNDANTYAVGHEIAQTVNQPWPADQLDQVRKAEAAILKRLKADAADAYCAHSEYAPNRKIDTTKGSHGQNMGTERARVAALMKPPVPPDPGIEEGEMKNTISLSDLDQPLVLTSGQSGFVDWRDTDEDDENFFGDLSIIPTRYIDLDTSGWLHVSGPCQVRVCRYDEAGSAYEAAYSLFDVPGPGGYVAFNGQGACKAKKRLRIRIDATEGDVTIDDGRWIVRYRDHLT